MRVFDFTLLSGYEFSGVDVAQGFRARLFAKNNVNAKFIFTELPTIRDMELYGSQKIKRGQIMSAHLFMTGRLDMSLSVKKEALLENEKENYEYDNIDEDGKVIRLYNSGEKSVEILCDEDGFVINESLFKNGKKYLENYYTDSLSYTELYNWDNDSNDGLNLGRRIFWNKQGQMVYEQCIYKDNVEYLFKNGEVIDNVEFLERFVKTLNLCENDICIMDRAGYLDYIQPLFENKGKSKLIAVLHSDHFYKIYEDESSLYMNYEYYYWFKYSEAIDYFVVGTDEHKRSLEAFLKEYDCFVPHIAAIPPGAIPEGKAHLYGRTFFNEDGSVCYEEVIEDDSTFYRIGAQVLYTKADLVGYMVKRLNLTADDVVIIDRTTGIGQAILENCGPARVGIVVHADHFSEGGTDDDYILWNNYYEYSFSQTEHIDFYITATDAQNELMRQQFKKYCGKEPHVVTIPVGSLDELKYPDEPRKRHSLITASRLATEKHCDWLVEAVVKAKESVPDISLDIYGKGGDEAKLKRLIGRLGCADYVHLMGQQKLDDVYKHYDAYVAASQSEGFGLTLMEAIGSGLPIVGFDVRYGNQTFIDDGQNGYKIPITDEMDQKEKIKLLSERIVRMFTEDDMDAFSGHSYEKAKEYLTKEVVHRWIELLK